MSDQLQKKSTAVALMFYNETKKTKYILIGLCVENYHTMRALCYLQCSLFSSLSSSATCQKQALRSGGRHIHYGCTHL